MPGFAAHLVNFAAVVFAAVAAPFILVITVALGALGLWLELVFGTLRVRRWSGYLGTVMGQGLAAVAGFADDLAAEFQRRAPPALAEMLGVAPVAPVNPQEVV
ncbi:hypothetical protein F5X99DRAFT_414536 [Biscogniauxia marginata]|nr:hypothetical protein F5X99DRAFT_414536 [Biscogniauxia marginata]